MLTIPATTYDDVFIPEIAAPLLAGLHKLDDETAAVTITLVAHEAEAQSMRN